ncbi:MAG: phosphate signaling complex protein PhoU [Candidatus Dormibacteraeota bacterium]|uniref:Phosphate-specific transport system accessory protein PhoU n=1 Tax=Candidatus Dormiibacter inghamiae TaxID=3127013 RepID=A0A934KB82_9BACT|nr:phosphate signaling complex protein PhoU [Candidatus Dormibacteraeota bacterium]MBJ7606846.1 phosphate signaling complex protein PhoU [Candidatus Dormibacteraeota bacterium]
MTVTRHSFQLELELLRESLLRMAGMVEAQIDDALNALRAFDQEASDEVRHNDQQINELHRQIREQVFVVIATQQPVASDLRTLMGVQSIALELERIGDYAVRIARRATMLSGLPHRPLRTEFGLMGEVASQQVRDILDALIEQNAASAAEVAAKDDEIDRLYHRVFDELIAELAALPDDADREQEALRCVTLIQVAHNLERIGDRIANVAEDIVFLQSGQVVEL